jgi:sugar lactone lactonase YvrE
MNRSVRRSTRPLLGSAGTLAGTLAAVLVYAGCSSTTTNASGNAETPDGGTPAAVGPACTKDEECADSAATPVCDLTAGVCVERPDGLPDGHEIGDGTAASVTFTTIYKVAATVKLTDLDFTGADELWAVGYGDNALYRGTGITSGTPTFKRILDPAAGHFMLKPPAIAAGTPGYIGTCGDNLNERGGGDGNTRFFMGPSLFVTDPAILGIQTADGLGSHVDMLHNTPLCRGIAHEKENIFWVFNGLDHSLDKYNFNTPHEPGGDDHSDGEIYRYAMGKVKGVEDGTPSHVFFDATDNFLYIADSGNARIVKLDTTKGTKGAPLARQLERIKANAIMDGTDVEVVVAAGTLTKPSGLEVHNGLIYVTDTATSTFHVFDKTGKEVRSLKTDLPPESLAGMAFGPDKKLYFADKVGGKLVRIDPL